MSAECASRTAWWRRWAGLPVVVALFFATSVVAAAPQAMGQRPDLRFVDHGGHGRTAPDLTAFAWLSERAGTRTIAWWHLRRDSGGHRAQAGREAYQVRGPPGQRAVDALS